MPVLESFYFSPIQFAEIKRQTDKRKSIHLYTCVERNKLFRIRKRKELVLLKSNLQYNYYEYNTNEHLKIHLNCSAAYYGPARSTQPEFPGRNTCNLISSFVHSKATA